MPFKSKAQRPNFAQLLIEGRSPTRLSRSGTVKREPRNSLNGSEEFASAKEDGGKGE
jgi:hypothetical protein